MRAGARRGVAGGTRDAGRHALALERRVGAAAGAAARAATGLSLRSEALARAGEGSLQRRRAALDSVAVALDGHDPQRTLERGYALVEDPAGRPVTSAAAARTLDGMTLRLHDGALDVRRDDAR